MISFDFEYYRPDTLDEAVNLYKQLDSHSKKPLYYGGGTEIISMARMNNVYTEAIIDIKEIPECNKCESKNNELTIGSAVTLTKIAELNFFPLLSQTVERIADHTIQDKITLGGNLAGTIIYREAVLPLMVSNAHISIANTEGVRKVPIMEAFDKRIKLNHGELIVNVSIDNHYLTLPFLHVKRTKNEKIDYPLITIVALNNDGYIQLGLSGLCEYPFRSTKLEKILNKDSKIKDTTITEAINSIPDEILNDIGGSSEYRKFMLHTMIRETIENLRGAANV